MIALNCIAFCFTHNTNWANSKEVCEADGQYWSSCAELTAPHGAALASKRKHSGGTPEAMENR